jgi:hypothetical protein
MEKLSASEHIHSKDFRFIYLFDLIAKRLKIHVDAYRDVKWFFNWHKRHLKNTLRDPELKLYEILMENTSDDLKKLFVRYITEINSSVTVVHMIDGDWTEVECDIVMRIWKLYEMYGIGGTRGYPHINNYPLGVVFEHKSDFLNITLRELEELSSQNP